MKRIKVLQSFSSEADPQNEAYVPGAIPGRFLIDGKQVEDLVYFTCRNVRIEWVKSFDPRRKPVIYIVYEADQGYTIGLRPLSAEQLGELKIGSTYRLTVDRLTHRDALYYAPVAEEL